ncbi:hypothetical protein [Baaleninema simplex]|uniref:hypothetical protein n=1 Tax=Baaleninema simplex TaxID=2862350 RepID=UPI00034B09FD|nr:hypothetical protein [Baaleninema simplex]
MSIWIALLLFFLRTTSVLDLKSISLTSVWQTFACEENMALPTISSWNDFHTLFPSSYYGEGLEVRVVGVYQRTMVRTPRPGPPIEVYLGNFEIGLDSRGGILLYPMWHPDAIRPAEEIERYEGQRVVVTGRVVPRAPDDPSYAATLIGPCFMTVDRIELAPLEESSDSATLERQGSDLEDHTTVPLPPRIPRYLTTLASWDDFQTHFPYPYTDDDLEQLDAFEVLTARVVGEYRQRPIRQEPNSPPESRGSIEIAFDSNGGILLEDPERPETLRSDEEIERYKGRQVEVIGEVLPSVPRHLSDNRASLGPFFTTVETIRLVP